MCAGALVEHRHRATTSRYYTQAELDRVLEINYLRFLVRAVDSGPLFRRLWREALERYRRTGKGPSERDALGILFEGGRLVDVKFPEERFLALTDGRVAVFPGTGSDVLIGGTREMRDGYAAVVSVGGEIPDGLVELCRGAGRGLLCGRHRQTDQPVCSVPRELEDRFFGGITLKYR